MSDHIIAVRQEGNQLLVNARDLHAHLEVKTPFKDWIKRRLEEALAIEGQDFSAFLSESTGGRPSAEYAITLDTAKQIAMLERSDKGRQTRLWFIEKEKELKARQSFQLPTNYLEALKALVASEEEKEAIKQQQALNAPKVEAFETFMDATGEYLVREVAKMLGTGEKRLFAQLRLAGVMLRDSTEPYQRFVDQGLFVVKARNVTVSGMFGSSERVTKTTYVTAKGVEFIRRLLKKEAQ